jgi:hypothetical protein
MSAKFFSFKTLFKMIRRFSIIAGMLLLAAATSAQSALDVLPDENWLPGWEYSWDAVNYEGDDLFFLINGGADLYMEYGFADVAAVEMSHPDKGSLYVEVYRMDSDSAAFGVFSLRSGSAPLIMEPSPWVVFGEDFLHVWQKNYYVAASGAGLDAALRLQVFNELVQHIRGQAPGVNELPGLVHRKTSPDTPEYAYLMGPLALSNVYSFGPTDVFNTREALLIREPGRRTLIFSYPSAGQAGEVFSAVTEYMKGTRRFSDLSLQDDSFTAVDRQGNVLHARPDGSVIRVAIVSPE